MDHDAAAWVRERYDRFARHEAPGRSSLYADWAGQVARDPALTRAVAAIAADRRQPPLVFAVARLLGAPEREGRPWRRWMLAHAEEVARESGRRRVQTNEPLRCAALVPALALIPGPIALLEVGAAAGLCLYPDRYSYRYDGPRGPSRLDPEDGPSAVVLRSRWDSEHAPPQRMPEIVWRAGIDLDPMDPGDPTTREWLTGLTWPGEEGRAERVEAALRIAAADPPLLVAGDATGDTIGRTAALAPAGAALVVSTPGVMPYISRENRSAVISAARAAGRWVTLDPPGSHDGVIIDGSAAGWPDGAFALALDGRVLAAADPLGRSVAWRSAPDPMAPVS